MNKLVFGLILAVLIFSFYGFYWVIFPSPNRMVDCKSGKYTFELMRKDCHTDYAEVMDNYEER